jgi:hypothetical protein
MGYIPEAITHNEISYLTYHIQMPKPLIVMHTHVLKPLTETAVANTVYTTTCIGLFIQSPL